MELAKLACAVQGKSAGYNGTTAPAVAVMGQIGALYVAQAGNIAEGDVPRATKAHRRTAYRDQI